MSYEDLSKNKDTYVLNRANFYIPTLVLEILAFASFSWKDDKDFNSYQWIFFSIAFIVSFIAYIISIERLWKIRIQINLYLFFFKHIPSQEVVNEFLDSLFKARDLYLRETYFFEPTKNSTYDIQKNNLQWLRRNEVISKSEFEKSKMKLDEMFKNEYSKIGFN